MVNAPIQFLPFRDSEYLNPLETFPGSLELEHQEGQSDKAYSTRSSFGMITSDKLRDIWEAKWKSRRSGNGALGHYRPLVIVLENRWKCESYTLLHLGRWLRNCAFALISDLHTHTISVNSLLQHPQSCYLYPRAACSGTGSVSSLSSRRQLLGHRSVKRTEIHQMPI